MALLHVPLFILSSVLLLWVAVTIGRLFARNITDAFWIVAALCYLQISSISLFLSLINSLTPYAFLCCQASLAILALALRGLGPRIHARLATNTSIFDLSSVEKGLLLLVVLLLCLSLAYRVLTPLYKGDVLYYHASRPLYWIQNSSIMPYPTVNDRQVVFAFGSNLIFMWPVLFTKSEFIGRLVYWLGLPAATFGFYTVLRRLCSSRRLGLLGIATFLSIPIVYKFGTNLEPLIWVCFFSLGTGYWALRIAQSSGYDWFFVLQLGLYSVLTGNMKNYGVVLIFASVVALLIALLQGKDEQRFDSVLRALRHYGLAVLIALVLSGLALLLVQNAMLFGALTGSNLRRQQNIAQLSPYQVYVHTIRLTGVLAEASVPVGKQFFDRFGNQMIHSLGADTPLPKENEWGWVRHYKYGVVQFDRMVSQGTNFGVAGILLLLGFFGILLSGIGRVAKGGFAGLWKDLRRSRKLAYAVVALSLLLGPAYLLRWFSGTRSFITPGIVCTLPLALCLLDHKRISKRVYRSFFVLLVIFACAFTLYTVRFVKRRFDDVRFDWPKIAYSGKYPHLSSDEHIPEAATVILLAAPNTKDYPLFGRHYTRRVVQCVDSFTEETLDEISRKYPTAFVYIDDGRCDPDNIDYMRGMVSLNNPCMKYLWGKCNPIRILEQSSKVTEVTPDGWTDAKLFRFIGSQKGQ